MEIDSSSRITTQPQNDYIRELLACAPGLENGFQQRTVDPEFNIRYNHFQEGNLRTY